MAANDRCEADEGKLTAVGQVLMHRLLVDEVKTKPRTQRGVYRNNMGRERDKERSAEGVNDGIHPFWERADPVLKRTVLLCSIGSSQVAHSRSKRHIGQDETAVAGQGKLNSLLISVVLNLPAHVL